MGIDLVTAVLLLVEFLGFSLLFNRGLGIPLHVTPPLLASFLTLTLYVADFAGALRATSLTLHLGGFSSVLYFAYVRFRSWTTSRDGSVSPAPNQASIALLMLFAAILFIRTHHGAFVSWDEFSHWGLVIRAVFLANTFHFDPTPLYFQDYPPGVALFCYHILLFLGYSEGNTYYAVSLLLLGFMTPALASARRAGFPYLVFVLATLFCLMYSMGSGWASVLIDQVLSILFAGSVITYYLLKDEPRSWWVLPLLLATLVLAKHAGQSFALLASGIIIADRFTHFLAGARQSLLNHNQHRFGWRTLAGVVALVGLPLLVGATWKHHVTVSGLSESVGAKSVVEFAKTSRNCCSTPREVEVAGRFFSEIVDLPPPQTNEVRPLSGYIREVATRFSLKKLLFESREFVAGKVLVILVTFGFLIAGLFPSMESRWRYGQLNFIMSLSTILYGYSLLLFYLYGMSEYEARQLASLDRFINVMLLAWSILFLFMVGELLAFNYSINGTKNTCRSSCVATILLITLVFWSAAPRSARSFLVDGAPPISDVRLSIQEWTSKVAPLIPPKARIFIGWQGSNGRELWIVRYEMLPRPANYNCYSLGRPSIPGDMYTCNLKRDELENMLSEYDFFVVCKGLGSLREQYGDFFDGPPAQADKALYQVVKTSHGVRLQLISVS